MNAQSGFERFEAFGVNKMYGLMEYGYGSEMVASQYKGINFKFTDYIALYNKQHYDFYYKETGEKRSLTDLQQPYIKLNNIVYQHFTDSLSSYLLPFTVNNLIKMPKKYTSLSNTANYLVAFLDNKFTIFDSINISTPKIKSIKADTYSEEFVSHNNTPTGIILFWGIKTIYVYNKDFHLLKSYKSNQKDHKKVLEIISKEFPLADKKEISWSNMIEPKLWSTSFENNVTTVSLYKDRTKTFIVKGNYEAQLVPGATENWVDLQNIETKKSYQFRVDFDNNLFLLPAKYITELGLKF